jgi:hypothetical protein
MQTLKLVSTANPSTYFNQGDLVRLSKLGICKVVEASKTVLTVLDALGDYYEVTKAQKALKPTK